MEFSSFISGEFSSDESSSSSSTAAAPISSNSSDISNSASASASAASCWTDLPSACNKASSSERATLSENAVSTSGCNTTIISWIPSSFIGRPSDTWFLSTINPAIVAASAASLVVTEPYSDPASEACRMMVKLWPLILLAAASASNLVSKFLVYNSDFIKSIHMVLAVINRSKIFLNFLKK